MPVSFKKAKAVLSGICQVADAERLLSAIDKNPDREVDLSKMVHVHAAILQVLMTRKPKIAAWPADPELNAWLKPALTN